jgi:hypothetical protein
MLPVISILVVSRFLVPASILVALRLFSFLVALPKIGQGGNSYALDAMGRWRTEGSR